MPKRTKKLFILNEAFLHYAGNLIVPKMIFGMFATPEKIEQMMEAVILNIYFSISKTVFLKKI